MNFDDIGVRLRNTVVSLVVCLTLIVNLVLSIATLAEPISLYTLLIYALLIYALDLLLQHAVAVDDVKEAMQTKEYPARFRTPLTVEFTAYVAIWLAWWFVSQVFFDAGLVFEQGFMLQLVLVPLVILALSINTVFETRAVYRRYIVVVLLFVSAVTLFFPTFSWAPQHNGALSTVLRVVLYFVSILIQDWLVPANNYASVPAPGDEYVDNGDLESGLAEKRHLRIASIVDTFERISEERWRAREFIALSAWILITPLVITLLLFLVSVAATFERSRRHVTLAPPVAVIDLPAPSPPVAAPAKPHYLHARDRTTSAIAATSQRYVPRQPPPAAVPVAVAPESPEPPRAALQRHDSPQPRPKVSVKRIL